MERLSQRYAGEILGELSCFDRVVLTGTLPEACHSQGMTGYLRRQDIRIFDYPRFAEPLRDRIRRTAEAEAKAAGARIEYVAKAHVRKEELVAKVLAERGDHPGLVHVLSAMESCTTYRPQHDKQSGRTWLRGDSGKCLHYYFYVMDPELGLCYVRVPTWCPFRLQVYFNGHNWLAGKLAAAGIGYRLIDNVFVDIDDFAEAQRLAASMNIKRLHRLLDAYARRFCPVMDEFAFGYHWSIMQAEYATDLVFRRPEALAPLYEGLTRGAIHAVKAEQVASFLGRHLNEQVRAEIGSRFSTRIEGTCVKHRYGPTSIKVYDKLGRVLRVETTSNKVDFFRHYREVEHRDGTRSLKTAPLRKSIYSLPDLRGLMAAANSRYIAFLSDLDDPSTGRKLLDKLTTYGIHTFFVGKAR